MAMVDSSSNQMLGPQHRLLGGHKEAEQGNYTDGTNESSFDILFLHRNLMLLGKLNCRSPS